MTVIKLTKQIFVFTCLVLSLLSCSNNNPKQKEKKLHTKNKLVNNSLKCKLVGDDLPNKLNRSLKFKNVQTIISDLNDDSKPDSIFIDKIIKWTDSDGKINDWDDPGEFHRIRILISGDLPVIWINVDGWVSNKGLSYFDSTFNKKNIVNSNYITVKRFLGRGKLIFCTGYTYASSPGLLTIIQINNKQPRLIFNKEAYLVQLKSLNKNGLMALVTSNWDKYQIEHERKSSYKVYVFEDGFCYNKELSKSFKGKD
ncbi:hypothetical protein LA303_00850 [Candidatus Sulfidibacterium hydrothermale]|uniref:hypothetical protein n=1 Tax=Candidatus Sulfidibacterium hydrothermale TaxID=2875962 RepID=UPI001F0A9C1F|nr:hypothetical protein [Candidatus Sulfidibacterium hydrothermale]UBM62544.1 hypothetical protein LA303_00850 [Candidatus Sulfidibacterium hydrothermale]